MQYWNFNIPLASDVTFVKLVALSFFFFFTTSLQSILNARPGHSWMKELSPVISVIMAHRLTKDLWFWIPSYSLTCPGKVGHIFALLYRKWNTKRWMAACMAFGSGWQIHYCLARSSKQSKCCFGEWAVTVPAARQQRTININKREKVRCPQGDCSEVHELEMSPISLGEGEQVYGMSLTSFLHRTSFHL